MQNIFEAVKNNPLFLEITYDEFAPLLTCLSARTSYYKKNEIIISEGDRVTFAGVIISGCVKIIKEDERGNVSMFTELPEAEIFGDILVCAGITHSPVMIFAAENTEILKINGQKIISLCDNACPSHKKLLNNILKLVAKKNFALNRKIEVLSKRTTREKILCFFDLYSNGTKKFAIPFNREEMAQYLCVDRSAMSNELCKMRDEGMLKFKKNKFEIL
ncbi:MAG: Crp/Fnr family transcriptional regulator [Lachnospiraceae bacterium]|nr:Crp/Fnr family transcriptional regulator [Lachnospiraceae bacterium]